MTVIMTDVEESKVTGGYATAADVLMAPSLVSNACEQSVQVPSSMGGYAATVTQSKALEESQRSESKKSDHVTSVKSDLSATSALSASRPSLTTRSSRGSLSLSLAYQVVIRSGLIESFVCQEFVKKPVVYDGLSSTLLLGKRKKDGLDVCIKIIEKDKCADKGELRRARQELAIHKDIPHHRNVVPSLDSEETVDAFLLVTPFTSSGDLWDLMKYGQTICEIEVRNCLAQTLEALRHIHGLGLIHGDIKPQNILLFKVEGRFVVQLCDFGLTEYATLEDGKIPFTGLRGTTGWYAPELIEEVDYNASVDVWPVGLMAFRMLGGYEPFYPATKFVEPVEFDESYFCHISAPCRDLVQQLLKLDPGKRANSTTAAQHIWFTGDPPTEPTQEMLQNLEEYGAPPATDLYFVDPAKVPQQLFT